MKNNGLISKILNMAFPRSTEKETQKPVPQTGKSNENTEQMMVKRITTRDMLQFTMIPYDFNCPVKHFIRPGGHPFAYIDLNHANQLMAKEELLKINEQILYAYEYIPEIVYKVCLHVGRVAFNEYSPNYGYTRLICTPYTPSGKVSKSPVCLDFVTRLDKKDYQANGSLHYGLDGQVLKADVHIRKNMHQKDYEGWSFYFKTFGRTFILHEVKHTSAKNGFDVRSIYKFSETL